MTDPPKTWEAKWISRRQDPADDLGVFVFRRRLALAELPSSMPIRVTADQRYRLYINGDLVAHGPARGDLQHWFFDTIDIASYLIQGENEILALVWNYGRYAPMAQMTARLGFVLDCEGVSTPVEWQVAKLEGHGFEMLHTGLEQVYIDVGPGEVVDLSRTGGPWHGSELAPTLDWSVPNVICSAEERGVSTGGTAWMLVPRQIPPMLYSLRPANALVVDRVTGERKALEAEIQIGPEGVLLDYGELLTAYPRIRVSGPPGANVTISYMESLWAKDGTKGNRNEVLGKEIVAHQDRIILGEAMATWEPLWWRTYRYIHLVSTELINITQLESFETGYPLEVESHFTAEHPSVNPIWNVAVRTAKRCAGETYFDCPYYEQLQYAGDTRIQAMIGYYLSRDRRLQRQAVEQFSWSVTPDGLTQSRYPSRQMQVISPFSLWWVLMVYDQWMYDRVPLTDLRIRQMYGVISAIRELQSGPSEGAHWTFADWVPGWRMGEPTGRIHASVHVATRLLAEIALAKMTGSQDDITNLRQIVTEWPVGPDSHVSVLGSVQTGQDEHTQALVRICQSQLDLQVSPWLSRSYEDKCTFYFQYYKHLAAPDNYLAQLAPWQEMLAIGLTTFAENPEPTRSDCHAWSAHPIVGFFQQIAGVTSDSPGWHKAKIAPNPGSLQKIEAMIPHPDGEITVKYFEGRLTINSPVPYRLVWEGKETEYEPNRRPD